MNKAEGIDAVVLICCLRKRTCCVEMFSEVTENKV